MDQLLAFWAGLSLRRKLVISGATAVIFLAVLGMSRLATAPSMSLLYSGLEVGTSGEVVAALEGRGIEFDVRGDAIYVPATQRDQLRMSLASSGLPQAGGAGYELLDTLSGFGTTSQMFDAAYWRAQEGELSRTIISSPQIRTARVHIGRETAGGLRRRAPHSASVTVTTSTGALSSETARALKFLVGSAVAGLQPQNVSVIDGQTGQVFAGDPVNEAETSTSDRAAKLKENVERLLSARVGPGRAVVEVAVETVNESEQITERRFDPEGRVAISTETEETSTDATEASTGVTVASALPTGDATGDGGNRSQNNQTRERTNYEVSETQREVMRAPGSIRRLTVAVLIDDVETVNDNGQVEFQPRSPEELADLRELVASAVGYDEARGDVIAIRSMAFEPIPVSGTIAEPSLIERLNIDVMQLTQLSILAAVALGLGLFVVKPSVAAMAQISPAPALTGPEVTELDLPILTGEIDDGDLGDSTEIGLLSNAGDGEFADLGSLAPDADPVERLRGLIEDRQDETVDILRGWMEKDDEVSS